MKVDAHVVCPSCGEPVDDDPTLNALREHVAELKAALSERTAGYDTARDQVRALREALAALVIHSGKLVDWDKTWVFARATLAQTEPKP